MQVKFGTMVRGSGVTGVSVPSAWDDEESGMASVLVLEGLDEGSVRACAGLTLPRADLERWEVIPPRAGLGRVVIMADMEGITGVPNEEAAVTPAEETGGVRTPAYAAACKAMTRDVLYAVAGARAAGAREIVVADTHWHDTNLSDADFDVPVVRGSQAALKAMQGADIAMLIGWHAKAGTPAACLPHTYTDRIAKLTIDGVEVGEIGMLQRLIASCGVPVVLVTGDSAAVDEVRWVSGHCEAGARPQTVVTKFVDADGGVKQRARGQVLGEIFCQAYTLARSFVADRDAGRLTPLVPFRPGDFEVRLRPGFEVEPDHEAMLTAEGTYRIRQGAIRLNYGAFQRLVDRLPTNSTAST